MTSTAHPRLAAVDALAHRFGGTLSEVLANRAVSHADKVAIRFLDFSVERAGVPRTLTFAELDRRVTAVGATLAVQARRGDRIAILAPQSLEFVVGFLAALRAGLVAVPLFSPDLPGHGDRLTAVLADCAPACVLGTSANVELVRATAGDATVIAVDAVPDTAGAGWEPPTVAPDDLAYLQYTSGSTRLPAGVQISHANVVDNAAQALVAGKADEDCTLVSWLPLFHDMGLVFVVGGSLVGAMTAVLMDPIAFLMRPARWLEQLAAHPGSFTAAPNFAFDFCAKRVRDDDRAGLDLSGVLIMFNGAEPVSLATLSRFYDAFEPHGLRRGVIAPSYGLAEATVYVTSEIAPDLPQASSFDLDALSHGHARPAVEGGASAELVACGSELEGAVVIADPATGTRQADGEVGEIWVRSASVGSGYWGKPEQSAEVFDQLLLEPGDAPASGWLRTGDLGVVVDDRLYVTGRIKDVLIVDGRNHYPHDLERTVEEAHEVIGRHRTAAFAYASGGSETAVVVAEVSRHHVDGDWDPADVRRALTRAVSRDHGLTLHDVVLIAPDTVPRTTSGKIARAASRTAYIDGTLSPARRQD